MTALGGRAITSRGAEPHDSGHHLRWAVIVAALAAIPRLLTVPARFITADEPLWMHRTDRFYDALVSLNLQEASAARDADGIITMPGVTTMWLGMVGRGLWSFGDWLGLWDNGDEAFRSSTHGLDLAQGAMAVAVAVSLGVVVYLVAEWVGRTPALVAGVLLATEPFFVAHGAVLHTDELSSMLGVGSLLAAVLVLGLPSPTRWEGSRRMAMSAGLLFGLAWLTKISALMFLLSLAVLLLWAAARRRATAPERDAASADETVSADETASADETTGTRGGRVRRWVRDSWAVLPWCLPLLRRHGLPWALAAVAVVLLTYPALWSNPIGEVPNLAMSSGQTVRDQGTYFLGSAREVSGPLFYFVALPLRVTPWFLALGVVAGAWVIWNRATRQYALVALALAAPTFLTLTVAAQQYDRYGLPVLIVGAIVVGIAAGPFLDAVRARLDRRFVGRRPRWLNGVTAVRTLGLAATLAVTAHTLAVAPWAMSYFNPAVGGSTAAEWALPAGWGEGMEEALAQMEDDIHARGEDCDDVEVGTPGWQSGFLRFSGCGSPTTNQAMADYVIIYVNQRQEDNDTAYTWLTAGREQVGDVQIRGITYAEVFGPRDDSLVANPPRPRSG